MLFCYFVSNTNISVQNVGRLSWLVVYIARISVDIYFAVYIHFRLWRYDTGWHAQIVTRWETACQIFGINERSVKRAQCTRYRVFHFHSGWIDIYAREPFLWQMHRLSITPIQLSIMSDSTFVGTNRHAFTIHLTIRSLRSFICSSSPTLTTTLLTHNRISH